MGWDGKDNILNSSALQILVFWDCAGEFLQLGVLQEPFLRLDIPYKYRSTQLSLT